jgi:hypothetical protein
MEPEIDQPTIVTATPDEILPESAPERQQPAPAGEEPTHKKK